MGRTSGGTPDHAAFRNSSATVIVEVRASISQGALMGHRRGENTRQKRMQRTHEGGKLSLHRDTWFRTFTQTRLAAHSQKVQVQQTRRALRASTRYEVLPLQRIDRRRKRASAYRHSNTCTYLGRHLARRSALRTLRSWPGRPRGSGLCCWSAVWAIRGGTLLSMGARVSVLAASGHGLACFCAMEATTSPAPQWTGRTESLAANAQKGGVCSHSVQHTSLARVRTCGRLLTPGSRDVGAANDDPAYGVYQEETPQ